MCRKLQIQILSLFLLVFSFNVFSQDHKLRVLYAAPEMYPLVCTGGLGEVAEFIPAAIVKEGHAVDVVLPKWSVIDVTTHGITPTGSSIKVSMPWGEVEADLYEIKYKTKRGVRIFLIDSPKGSQYFSVPPGEKIYYEKEYEENIVRFVFFSKAVLELAKLRGNSYYDIIHSNDWTTALVSWYKKYDPRYNDLKAKTVYSIHNLGGSQFQGVFDFSKLWLLQIDDKYLDPTIDGSIANYGNINLTKAAAVSADQIVTVSEQYAEDIKTAKYGNYLDGILKTKDIIGIPHGIDEIRYNPSINNIEYNFDNTNFVKIKELNKKHVLELLGFPISDVPLFISTTRGDRQKNVVLLYETLKMALPVYDMQVVIMGDGYENIEMDNGSNLKQKFEVLEKNYKNKFRFMKYDANFHPQLEAAADFQFIISLFEPGGLEPSKAKINRVVSIIHPVNGLSNSVIGSNDKQGRPQTGINVYNLDSKDMSISISNLMDGIKEAMSLFGDKEKLNQIRSNMDGDYSWAQSGRSHTNMYESLVFSKSSIRYTIDVDLKTGADLGVVGGKFDKSKSGDVLFGTRLLSDSEALMLLSNKTGSLTMDLDFQIEELMKIWAERDGVLGVGDMVLCFGHGDGYSEEGIYEYVLRKYFDGKYDSGKWFLVLSGALFAYSSEVGELTLLKSSIPAIRSVYEFSGLLNTSFYSYMAKSASENLKMFEGSQVYMERFNKGYELVRSVKK